MTFTDEQVAMIQEQVAGGVNPLVAVVNVLKMLDPRPGEKIVFDCVEHREGK